jgi:cystathionine beta-lyase
MATPALTFNFDAIIDREHSDCVKYAGRLQQFGHDDLLPLWVADMDFACPPAVTQALQQRAAHPIYGYSVFPESIFSALIDWLRDRHQWQVNRQSILMCPGVVPCLSAAVLAFTQPGDGVIVQPPVYFPFFSAVTQHQRHLIENPLQLKDGHYQMDFEHIEQCAKQGAKLLLLCSPHNPVGRVWQQSELLEILRIARQYNLIIVADEIHADLVYAPHRHLALARLAELDDRIITAVAPSKTFNIPGLGLSSLIIDKPTDRQAIQQIFDDLHLSARNPFSITAFEAAYRFGGDWKDALMLYLQDTQNAVIDFTKQHLPGITALRSEGTYLMWLDCRALNLDDQQLTDFFWHQAKVGLNAGISFGTGGSGFMRLNIAAPRQVVMEGLERIRRHIHNNAGCTTLP